MSSNNLLDEKTRETLNKEFSALKKPLTIFLLTDKTSNQQYENQAVRILDEISSLPSAKDKITLIKKSISSPGVEAEAKQYGITPWGTPAITLLDEDKKPTGIIFYGVPGGYEFKTFIEATKMISDGDSGLKPETRELITKLETSAPIEIKIFITLTCPYCPAAVKLAEQFAYESKGKIIARTIDASAFSELATKYNIFSVPRLIINDTDGKTGAPTENELAELISKFRKPSGN